MVGPKGKEGQSAMSARLSPAMQRMLDEATWKCAAFEPTAGLALS